MFTGIVETTGVIEDLNYDNENLNLTIQSSISRDLRVDESVSHDGVCLTVTHNSDTSHKTTLVPETIKKSRFSDLEIGSEINIERSLKISDRLDGHIVQGHVDQIAKCISAETLDGSWFFTFEYNKKSGNMTIEKGSITVNGVSLTVVNSEENRFSVAIIPYTFEHTNFKQIEIGSFVNLEFDMIGKYIAKLHLKG